MNRRVIIIIKHLDQRSALCSYSVLQNKCYMLNVGFYFVPIPFTFQLRYIYKRAFNKLLKLNSLNDNNHGQVLFYLKRLNNKFCSIFCLLALISISMVCYGIKCLSVKHCSGLLLLCNGAIAQKNKNELRTCE